MTSREKTATKDFWPATYEEVEEAHLQGMLAATPAQRLDMAEQLLKLYLAGEKARGLPSPQKTRSP